MAQRRAVDAHEDQAQPIGDVFHQRGLAVAGRRNQQQQAGSIRAPGLARRADLLGEVGADEGQVHLVDQPVAHEAGHGPGLELRQLQALALGHQQVVAQRLQGLVAGHGVGAVLAHALPEVVHIQRQRAALDARMLAAQARHARLQAGVDAVARHVDGQLRRRVVHAGVQGGFVGRGIALPDL